MNGTTIRPETVVAQGDHQRLVIGGLEGVANHQVGPAVLVLDHPGHQRVGLTWSGWEGSR